MVILRLKYKKDKNLKFISHLELMKTVERIFRRMELPLKFTQGFNPHPKISFAAPLPVGVSSESEYLDVELTEKVHLKGLIRNQKPFMPEGLEFVEGIYLQKTKSLMSLVTSSEYVINLETEAVISAEKMQEMINQFLDNESIILKKKNKKGKLTESNIRERIYNVTYMTAHENSHMIRVKLSTGSEGNLKPEVMLTLFNEYESVGIIAHKTRIHRIALMGKVEGKEVDLLESH